MASPAKSRRLPIEVTITPEEARRLMVKLEETNEIFTVDFVKRGNGEMRSINARFRVHVGLKGEEKKYSPADHNLFLVYDMKKREYRNVSMEGIKLIKRKGDHYRIERPITKKHKQRYQKALALVGRE